MFICAFAMWGSSHVSVMAMNATRLLLLLCSSTSASISFILYLQQLEALGFIDWMFSNRRSSRQLFPVGFLPSDWVQVVCLLGTFGLDGIGSVWTFGGVVG